MYNDFEISTIDITHIFNIIFLGTVSKLLLILNENIYILDNNI